MHFSKSPRPPVILSLLVLITITSIIPLRLSNFTPAEAAAGRLPLILLPGLSGSRMENDPDGNGVYGEVWPNGDRLILDPWDLSLLVLKLAPDGILPFNSTPDYTSVRVGDIIRDEFGLDFYATTIAFFTGPGQGYEEGVDFFVCSYDWRKDLQEIAFGALAQTLDRCIATALAKNPGAARVNILAHSMGGLVSRHYLTDPVRAQKVHRLVTLGAPLLGAPKIVLSVIDRLCIAELLGVCFTNTDVLHELIQNYPVGYQIAPGADYFRVYPRGYYRRDRDADGDGRWDGYLDSLAAYRILEAHNRELAVKAQATYTRGGGWGNGGAEGLVNGVEVFAIAGDQQASIGMIVEYEQRPWYNPWGAPVIAYRAEVTNGDGTVPLHSADLHDRAQGVDLSGGVPVFYFNVDHGALPKHPPILELAAKIFASPSPVSVDGLLQPDQQAAPQVAGSDGPRTEPLPLNGSYLAVEGPAAVDVIDNTGKRLARPGEIPGEQNTISGASYTELGSGSFIFLPGGGRYEIWVSGEEPGLARLRLQKIVNDTVIQTVLYNDLPLTGRSRAFLVYDPAAPAAGDFLLDQDGNSSAEGMFPPSYVLDARGSQDITPPVTRISLHGTLSSEGNFAGPVTASLSTTDGGESGVAKIEYSLDGGQTIQRYQGPFQVDPQVTAFILARATDRAGNEEARPVSAPLVPNRNYLPAVQRP